jgi:hypothetical protein
VAETAFSGSSTSCSEYNRGLRTNRTRPFASPHFLTYTSTAPTKPSSRLYSTLHHRRLNPANWAPQTPHTHTLSIRQSSSQASPAEFEPYAEAQENMVASKIDGTAVAKAIRERLKNEIVEKQGINPRYKPCLKIIQGTCLMNMDLTNSWPSRQKAWCR